MAAVPSDWCDVLEHDGFLQHGEVVISLHPHDEQEVTQQDNVHLAPCAILTTTELTIVHHVEELTGVNHVSRGGGYFEGLQQVRKHDVEF